MMNKLYSKDYMFGSVKIREVGDVKYISLFNYKVFKKAGNISVLFEVDW